MIEIAALAIVTAVFGAAVLFHASEARAWRAERSQLLDRLMARNWGEYVQGIKPADDTPRPQLVTDELEAEWAEAHEQAEVS